MATLELSLNTETRALSVTIDGQVIDHLRCVEVYQYPEGDDDDDDDRWQPRFTVTTAEQVGGVSRRVYLTASDRGGRPEGLITASRFPGVLEVREDAIASAMERLVAGPVRR